MRFLFQLPYFVTLVCLFLAPWALAQNVDFSQQFHLTIQHTMTQINVDGVLNEAAWQQAEKTSPFWESKPNDKELAKAQTRVQTTYDDKYLYIAAHIVCSNFTAQTRKRDQAFWESESFAVILDPMNRKSNGFFFGVSVNNVQSDDNLTSTLFNEMSFSWNNKWLSATQRYDTCWTVEIAIPLKILPYKSQNLAWGINFLRVDFGNNQITTWTKVPVNFWPIDLGYTGTLRWQETPPIQSKNVALIPYLTEQIEADSLQTRHTPSAGLDAKVALNSALNLDITLNPDFSQIEVDAQQTNLGRFSLFYPERRNFFLENGDIFGSYAIPWYMTPFFSRRIGLDKAGNAVPILYGVRLSGNVTSALRIGAMNMHTRANEIVPGQNYTAISAYYRLLKRSTLKGYVLSRVAIDPKKEKNVSAVDAYGRNTGLEFQYINQSGKLSFTPSVHYSAKSGIRTDNWFYNLQGRYRSRNMQLFSDFIRVGTNYYADMGFSTRLETYDLKRDTTFQVGFSEFYNRFDYFIRPKRSVLNTINFKIWDSHVWNPDGSQNEIIKEFGTQFDFKNRSYLNLTVNHSSVNIRYPFRVTDALMVDKGSYRFSMLKAEYSSSNIKPIYYTINVGRGGYYGGTIQTVKAGLTYRVQPWGNMGLNTEYNQLTRYGITETIWLISPKVEINFSTSLFWTTFLQYNTQLNNVNVNSRFQWRYKPMSDVYLVYTDNYFVDPLLKNKNRALVLKFNYWLNL
ncbi:DUF5916 domain-containing protein [Spirosoma soli]|uniref:DUF5916 domain-containing protein n=1 Tax=Spirosoma soli TaxID=1770529 RepID=A0ABW5LY74_9BACT